MLGVSLVQPFFPSDAPFLRARGYSLLIADNIFLPQQGQMVRQLHLVGIFLLVGLVWAATGAQVEWMRRLEIKLKLTIMHRDTGQMAAMVNIRSDQTYLMAPN